MVQDARVVVKHLDEDVAPEPAQPLALLEHGDGAAGGPVNRLKRLHLHTSNGIDRMRRTGPQLLLATVGVRQGASTQGADAGHAAFSQFGLARWQAIDMPQTYWLDLFTVETWKEFLDHGGDVTGFREKRWKTVQKIKHGDYLLCYLTGASRWVGLLEVTSEPVYDETPGSPMFS